jgi:hypothetical protein
MKDILVLDSNNQPYTSLHTCEAIAKMGGTVLSHPVCNPDLAPFNYHLFGHIKDALCERHFANDNKLKQSLCDVLQSQGREFYNAVIQHLTQHWKSVLKMMETLWKMAS